MVNEVTDELNRLGAAFLRTIVGGYLEEALRENEFDKEENAKQTIIRRTIQELKEQDIIKNLAARTDLAEERIEELLIMVFEEECELPKKAPSK